MDQPDDEIEFEPSEELIERVERRRMHQKGKQIKAFKKRDRLHHLFRVGQGNAARSDQKAHQRPTPSLPPLPWDKKD